MLPLWAADSVQFFHQMIAMLMAAVAVCSSVVMWRR